jgi:methyltransferase (TIGR00027 family)
MQRLGSTAEVCAAFRTLASVDPLAPRFLRGAKLTSLARVRPLHPFLRAVSERLVAGAYAYETARTLHLDELVEAELGRGAEQLVLLGAGFDSRAHRFAVQTFEVDLPALQRRKRRLAVGLPRKPAYVEGDLESDDVLERLLAAGFDLHVRTLVLWIGVSMYVSPAAVQQAIGLAAGLAPGSLIAFDYVFRQPADDFLRAVERRGEPCRFGVDDARTIAAGAGLDVELDLCPEDLSRRYLGGHRLPYRFIAIAHARVP